MMNLVKRFFRRMFRSLVSMYGPAVLTIIFALVQGVLFPDSPIWLIPLFFVFVMIVLSIYEIVNFKR
ncbi:hypothetical protein C3432_26725 [Citrobacter amalonaticus]|uniref:Uncharacterized protein n=1 Tax=Citrobacter amalonaticus TaxID=35703 RepID=A0A2S4RQU7_CITAM|nr:hypothetical protein [Citrobacter amalonaticus]POT54604.1 hypothetical protein C3432_26725 [Citrobacter amalonaticus]POT69549.1 hypothetical protein C3436_26330 [Citrobacter amalonaticus]POU60360.1 hypothetical protein C3430_25250 [Citrobacter amalonaticus]POV02655.1 hypothetical protein C3424_25430 [Citrobacter amalonaticus]